MIAAAADGDSDQRAAFARRYAPALRSYLAARWPGPPLGQEIEDAVQVVFLECLKADGVLANADVNRSAGFRGFLYGTVRNVARRFEDQLRRNKERSAHDLPEPPDAGGEARLSQVFDRAWAARVMRDAAIRQSEWAAGAGEDAMRRVELLRLRFQEGLPIRIIAARWEADPARLHHEYAQARREFKRALLEVVAFDQPADAEAVNRECRALLSLLG